MDSALKVIRARLAFGLPLWSAHFQVASAGNDSYR